MTIPSFSTGTQWHKLKLDGVTIPGVAELEATLGDMRDKQKAAGGNKTRTRNKGSKGAEFDVTVRLADAEELTQFEQLAIPVLRKRSNAASPDPHTITHPMAALCGVSTVTIGEIKMSPPNSKDGIEISFKLTEWAPEPKEAKQPAPAPKPESAEPTQPRPTMQEQVFKNAGLIP